MIRYDLAGITAPVMRTDPNDPKHISGLNPKQNYGYFEYGENQFADLQGEDTDDYIRFTDRGPRGPALHRAGLSPAAGYVLPPINPAARMPPSSKSISQTQPITITSKYAEVIYFLRNGNLYRRVFLVAPDRQSSIISPNPYNMTGAADVIRSPGSLGSASAVRVGKE